MKWSNEEPEMKWRNRFAAIAVGNFNSSERRPCRLGKNGSGRHSRP